VALKETATELLTIDSTAAGVKITASKYLDANSQPFGHVEAVFQHLSGDGIYSVKNGSTNPSTTGANGEKFRQIGDEWRVKGQPDVAGWRAIRDGSISAKISVSIETVP
jgi:hypothetical protein